MRALYQFLFLYIISLPIYLFQKYSDKIQLPIKFKGIVRFRVSKQVISRIDKNGSLVCKSDDFYGRANGLVLTPAKLAMEFDFPHVQ